ncbi:hypothetical protein [Novosphingobium sp.]|uniref:hypothetical protein n=1 Tax=Novosphingobium sp. TaxID=1874826 RepID=UPI003B529CE2
MPDPVETQTAPASSGTPSTGADSTAPAGGARHTVAVVRRDMSGQVIDAVPVVRTAANCSHGGPGPHAPGVPLCAPQQIHDPTSVGPILVALVCGILIVCGALTFTERGPGKLIKPKPRRRGATQRARRWRRRVGAALVVLGVLGLVRAFV